MKPTQITELLANIRKTFVSFFSILMFVALGIGIFLGISWTAPALKDAAQNVFDEGSFHNFQIQFPYGLTEADLKELGSIDGVTQIEKARQSFQTLTKDELEYIFKVQTIGDNIDTPIVVEGEIPKKAKEIALHVESARKIGLGVGDTIVFDKDSEGEATALSDDEQKQDPDGMAYLNGSSFKVTGLINTADYVALEPATYGLSTTPSGRGIQREVQRDWRSTQGAW